MTMTWRAFSSPGSAFRAHVEVKPLQPMSTTALRLSVDVGEVTGISGAPTLVVNPSPPFALLSGKARYHPRRYDTFHQHDTIQPIPNECSV